MSAWRALLRTVRRRLVADGADDGTPPGPPVPWGRIGGYEAVSRSGVLFLLDPEPAHPSMRMHNPG